MERRLALGMDFGGRNLLAAAILGVAAILLLTSCSTHEAKTTCTVVKKTLEPQTPLEPGVPYTRVDYDYPFSQICSPRIFIYKGERKLLLVNDGVLIREYRVGLGPHPSGDKFREGDGRTPEGDFYVCVKNSTSKFYKSLGLNYPTPKHAELAMLAGYISPDDYKRIVQASESMNPPPWNTHLGGAIFIHGGGAQEDWTKGCIAVYNSAIDELFQIVSVGTPVSILP